MELATMNTKYVCGVDLHMYKDVYLLNGQGRQHPTAP